MGQFDLNLSTRPFKPYRAANLGLLAVFLVLVAVSMWQGYTYRQYAALRADVRANERKVRTEADALTARLSELNSKLYHPQVAAKLNEVEFLNLLLTRKSFSWTRVFATLEAIMPVSVHLVNLKPSLDENNMIVLEVTVRGRSVTDATGFVRTLEDSSVFENVIVKVEQMVDSTTTGPAAGEVEFVVNANYLPEGSGE